MSSEDAFVFLMSFLWGCGVSMIEKSILAALAAWAAAVTGPAIPPIDITIVMIDVSMLS